jgi:hypothetical protein
MRPAVRSASVCLAAVLASCVALPARAVTTTDAVLQPEASWRRAFAWAGGETADHVLLATPGDPFGTPSPATLHSLDGVEPAALGSFDKASGWVFRPRLLGGTVALPVAGESVFTPTSVTFREIATGDEQTIVIGATERLWAYAGPGVGVVGVPDATDSSRTDLYLRSATGDTKVYDNAMLSAQSADVLADGTGAVVYDGGRMLVHVDFATGALRRVDDPDWFADVTARPTYLTATEIGYRNSDQLVRVPRAGGTAVRVAYTGNVDVVRHVGSRLVLSRYSYPAYELVTIPEAGGTPSVLPVPLSDNQIESYGTGEVAAFGTLGDGTSGRIAVDVATGAARMLVALAPPPAAPRGLALSGGRVAISDDHVFGDRLVQASVDPSADPMTFGPRSPLAVRPWSSNSCNGGICGPVAAFGSLTAFVQEPPTFAHTGELVVLDGTTEIARIAVNPNNVSFDLGGDHLLYRAGNAARLRNLRTGADAATTLQDLWGPYGYEVASNGDVVRRHLTTGAVDVARAAGGGCTPDYVAGRAQWVRWHAHCDGGGEEWKVRDLSADTGVAVPEWARALGDGIAVGWNGVTLTAVDLTLADHPQTPITTTTSAFSPRYTWAVDETEGRLVAFADESDQTVHVRRLTGPTSPVTLLRQAVPAPVAGSWQPSFDFSGGVDWTLTIAGGTAQQTVLTGSSTDGVVRPVWNVTSVAPGAYSYSLAAVPRDGSAAPPDVTGTVVVPAVTSLTLPAPAQVTYGTPVSLVATLLSGATPVAGQIVTFETRTPGTPTWSGLGTRVTAATGTTPALSHVPSATAEYRARFAGTASYVASTAARTVAVATKVTAVPNVTSALNGTTLRITGTVSPAHTGSVLLQRGLPTGWQTAATGTLSGSSYAFTVRPTATGIYKYRVVKPADSDHAAGISPTVTYTAYRVAIASISATSEYAVLRNTGTTTVNLGSWLLDAGASTERFRLPTYFLAPGRTVRIATGYGTNGGGVLYLRRSAGIWATHDTGSLYDPRGALSSRLAY